MTGLEIQDLYSLILIPKSNGICNDKRVLVIFKKERGKVKIFELKYK